MIRLETIGVQTITEAVAVAGLLAGIVSLFLIWRGRLVRARDIQCLREEMNRGHRECLRRIDEICENLKDSEKNAQASLELLRDGRLGMPARARALRMLRSGMAAETAAVELGLPRNEIQLLGRVAALLAPRN